jgi:hypothetical protein
MRLAKSTQANVGLAILDQLSALYLEHALGEANMNCRQRVGFRLPRVRTATGRACIEAMNLEQRDRTLERLRQAYPGEWHLLRDQIEDAITQVRVRGYCICRRHLQSHQRHGGSLYCRMVVPFWRSIAVDTQGFTNLEEARPVRRATSQACQHCAPTTGLTLKRRLGDHCRGRLQSLPTRSVSPCDIRYSFRFRNRTTRSDFA